MSHGLDERVEELEKQMAEQVQASAELTDAVRDLTNVLVSSKLAMKILFSVFAIGASIVTTIYWLATHITFTQGQ